jgi:hypothetical protein
VPRCSLSREHQPLHLQFLSSFVAHDLLCQLSPRCCHFLWIVLLWRHRSPMPGPDFQLERGRFFTPCWGSWPLALVLRSVVRGHARLECGRFFTPCWGSWPLALVLRSVARGHARLECGRFFTPCWKNWPLAHVLRSVVRGHACRECGRLFTPQRRSWSLAHVLRSVVLRHVFCGVCQPRRQGHAFITSAVSDNLC